MPRTSVTARATPPKFYVKTTNDLSQSNCKLANDNMTIEATTIINIGEEIQLYLGRPNIDDSSDDCGDNLSNDSSNDDDGSRDNNDNYDDNSSDNNDLSDLEKKSSGDKRKRPIKRKRGKPKKVVVKENDNIPLFNNSGSDTTDSSSSCSVPLKIYQDNETNTESSPPTSIVINSTSINDDTSGSTADADEGSKQGSNAKVGCQISKPESSKDSEEIFNTEETNNNSQQKNETASFDLSDNNDSSDLEKKSTGDKRKRSDDYNYDDNSRDDNDRSDLEKKSTGDKCKQREELSEDDVKEIRSLNFAKRQLVVKSAFAKKHFEFYEKQVKEMNAKEIVILLGKGDKFSQDEWYQLQILGDQIPQYEVKKAMAKREIDFWEEQIQEVVDKTNFILGGVVDSEETEGQYEYAERRVMSSTYWMKKGPGGGG